MKRISPKSRIKGIRRIVPALAGIVALALAGCGSQTAADAGKQAGGPGHAATHQPVTQRTAVKQPATTTSFPDRCKVAYLRTSLHLAHVAVDSAAMNSSGTVTPMLPQPVTGPLTGLPAFCAVTLTEFDAAGNPIHIDVWLPTSWNGRFQGVGGAIYSCGPYYYEMAPAIQEGYAAAATDCGVSLADRETASWALKDGRLDRPLIDDFAYAGVHDMTVVGKAVTKDYYPSPLRYSYFNGCSTGGREGLVEAQQYPADYNGIVSGAPAINWTQFIPAEIWPQLVMNESHDFLPSCKEIAFTDAAVQACASAGGVITNPSACRWSPYTLVGEARHAGSSRAGRCSDDEDLAGSGELARQAALVRAGTRRKPGRPGRDLYCRRGQRRPAVPDHGQLARDMAAAEPVVELANADATRSSTSCSGSPSASSRNVRREQPRPVRVRERRREDHHLAWPS